MQETLKHRIIGFAASLVLTLLAYSFIVAPEFFHMDATGALIGIYTLAFVQATVQFIFFLDIWRESGELWNLGVFISTILLILTIILFSMWIMHNLNYNMMLLEKM